MKIIALPGLTGTDDAHGPACDCCTAQGAEDVLCRRPDLADMAQVGARYLAALRESA